MVRLVKLYWVGSPWSQATSRTTNPYNTIDTVINIIIINIFIKINIIIIIIIGFT